MFGKRMSLLASLLLAMILILTSCTPAAPTPTQAPAAPEQAAATTAPVAPAATEAPAPVQPTAAPAASEAPPAAEPAVGGTYTLQISEEPPTMDLQKSGAAVTAFLWRYLGDPLIAKNFDGEYVPGLAESWEISDDGLTWDFTLKKGVKFHDGEPLNAAAVVTTFERALDPATASPIAGSLLGPVDKIEATGDLTFTITLKEPLASFLENLTDQGRLSILSPKALAEMTPEEFSRAPVSTGPWMFKEWATADHITLVRNPDYNWAPEYVHQGPVYLEELVFRIITESATAQAAFEGGELTQLALAPADVIPMQESGRYKIDKYMRLGVGLFLEFNVTKAPFDDPLVRKAFNYAIDKQAVLDIALEGLGTTAHGPLPPSIRGYWEGIVDYAPDYDPEQAAALLDQAGWTLNAATGLREKNGQPLQFTVFNAPIDTWKASAQVVQSQLKELGITMDIQSFEFGTMLEKARAGEQQAVFMGYTYTTPDIVDLWFHSKNIGTGLTLSHNNDPKLDAMIEEQMKTVDWDKRQQILIDIQKYIVDNSIWVPLWINDNYVAVQPEVEGTRIHRDGYMVLNDAYFK